jgi:hypothetical protein
MYTTITVQAYQTSKKLLSTWCRAAAFFSASGAALSQEVADGKINVQSACALNTQYNHQWKITQWLPKEEPCQTPKLTAHHLPPICGSKPKQMHIRSTKYF